jgi:hypothetical protein
MTVTTVIVRPFIDFAEHEAAQEAAACLTRGPQMGFLIGCRASQFVVVPERLTVLWLCGPFGAGKSTVGWELYEDLVRSGVRAGFLDIDQLGLVSLPASPGDPHRYRLKETNMAAVAGNYRAAGCDVLVAAGSVHDAPDVSSATLSSASLSTCRLQVSPEEQRRRLTSRGNGPDFIANASRQTIDRDRTGFTDACIDTDGRTAAEVADLVRERCGWWPPSHDVGSGAEETEPELLPAVDAEGDVLLVCGATGVGKSEAAFAVFIGQLRAGAAAAYVDLDQIGFLSQLPTDDPSGHRFKARNLADIWRTHHAAGARRLVLSGPVSDEHAVAEYAKALPAARITVCRLHADPAELAHRIWLRGQGRNSWPQPGDPLLGQSEDRLRQVAARSAVEAEALERSGLGGLRFDTNNRTAAEVADLITQHW